MSDYGTIFNSANFEEKNNMIGEILSMDSIPNIEKETLVDMLRFTRNQCVSLINKVLEKDQQEEKEWW